MMQNTLLVRNFAVPPISIRDVLRYAGVPVTDIRNEAAARESVMLAKDCFSYRVCYRTISLTVMGDTVDFSFAKLQTCDLARNLAGCDKAVIFAATVGAGIDRLIARYSHISPARALFLQALGAERIEALCNMFENDIIVEAKKDGWQSHPRFSPGYGDFPLYFQTELIRVLDTPRKIGLTLNRSLLMSPTKSVTAVIGLSRKEAGTV